MIIDCQINILPSCSFYFLYKHSSDPMMRVGYHRSIFDDLLYLPSGQIVIKTKNAFSCMAEVTGSKEF